jgi:hypothetical protein
MKNNIYNRHIVFTSVGTGNYSFYKYIIATILKRCKLYGQADYTDQQKSANLNPCSLCCPKKNCYGISLHRGIQPAWGGGTHLRDVTDGGLRLGSPGLAAEETTTARCSLLQWHFSGGGGDDVA